MIAGFPVHFAIGTNKVSSVMGTSIAFTKFMRDGYMPLKLSVIGIICALMGSSLGARTALLISDYAFKILMLVILPVTAYYVFRSQNLLTEERETHDEITTRTYIVSALVGFLLGFYDGFYGPGAGTFMLLLMAGAARLSVQKANGCCVLRERKSHMADGSRGRDIQHNGKLHRCKIFREGRS